MCRWRRGFSAATQQRAHHPDPRSPHTTIMAPRPPQAPTKPRARLTGVAVESFDDVRGLTESELRDLLDAGRPEQRVWALWALALRSTQPGALDTVATRDEPNPGVRRNFAVVLAGHGHYDLLVALALRDPSDEVRAAALQLITRIAIDGKLPSSIVADRIPGESAAAKLAVLATVFAGVPDWLGDLAEQLLTDSEPEVRYETFDALLRVGRSNAALMWLEEAPEGEARIVLMRWTARGNVRPVAVALAGSSRRLRRLLVEVARISSWHDIAPAVASEPVLVKAVLGRAPQIEKDLPLGMRIRIALLEPHNTWMYGLADRLEAVSSPDPELASALPDLIDRCAREAAALEDTSGYDEVLREDLGDWRTFYARIVDAASRLLVH